MELKPYEPQDLEEILRLFYETVHSVNSRDYTPSQLDAWAPKNPDRKRWGDSLLAHHTAVAWEGGQIVGFADLDDTGYFDRLFVSKDFQRRGVASRLSQWVEETARQKGICRLTTEASITARPFFERQGYRVVEEQHKPHNGEVFINYRMEKILSQVK